MTSGSVQWTGGGGPSWLWTGRPEWWSQIQGAGVVFDRALALEWKRRADAALAAGLADQADWRSPRAETARAVSPATERGVVDLCRTGNGPDWVVAPIARVDGGVSPDAVPSFLSVWRAPATEYRLGQADRRWVAIRDYGFASCERIRRRADPG